MPPLNYCETGNEDSRLFSHDERHTGTKQFHHWWEKSTGNVRHVCGAEGDQCAPGVNLFDTPGDTSMY